MDLFTVIKNRRSVRQFTAEPVGRTDLDKIVAAGIEAPSGCNMQLRQYLIVDDPQVLERMRAVSPKSAMAPAAIVVLVEPKGTAYGEYYIQDAAAAIENMLLATVALGYASCWLEGNIRGQEAELRRILGVPDTLRLWAVLPIGKAASHPERPAKSHLAEVTHYNVFGSKAGRS